MCTCVLVSRRMNGGREWTRALIQTQTYTHHTTPHSHTRKLFSFHMLKYKRASSAPHHTHAHARTHNTCVSAHTNTHIHTFTHIHTPTHKLFSFHMLTYKIAVSAPHHTHMHARTHTQHTCKYSHKHTHTFRSNFTCTNRGERLQPPQPGRTADVPLYVAAFEDRVSIYRDLSGISLHRYVTA
jgi:hypothetical protein